MDTSFLSDREKRTLELDVRRNIYKLVQKNAGLHFREIERKSKLSTGSVQYHLDYLVRNRLLKVEKDGNSSRYYTKEFNSENKLLIGLLRQRSIRTILLFILENHDCTHDQVAKYAQLAPSTVSWYLKKLESKGIVKAKKDGRNRHYTIIAKKEDIMGILVTYQESFFDSLVDNIIEMWDVQ